MKKVAAILLLIVTMAFQFPEKPVRIFMIGDSTMANKPLDENPERGWGQFFPQYLTSDVEVKNYAVNGRSTKSFIKEGRWDTVMNQLQAGDYVIIQFGHNDSKIDDSTRYAAPQTTYRENLIKYITDARSKGANPILLTPVMRRKFDSKGAFVDQHGEYPGVVKDVAAKLNVPMIDLHKSSQALIEKEGVENSKRLFLNIPPNHFKKYKGKEEDNTHFSEYGAASVASLVCQSIKEQNLALAKYLKPSDFKEKYAFELPKIYVPHFKKDTFNVINYGAIGNGYTLNSKAINTAIDSCAANGGGTVLIPRGSWLTGPIVMKSNIDLHLADGALVIFTSDFNQYPLVLSSFEGVDAARCQAPVTAENLENIAITGNGIMNGNGYYWRPLKKSKLSDGEWKNHLAKYGGVLTEDKKTWYSSAKALKGLADNNIGKIKGGKQLKDFEEIKDFLRPNMIRIANCKNILLQDVTFENSPAWTTHLMLSDHITLKNVRVKNPWFGTNTDALDLESCTYANVQDCIFDTGDDGITIKSGRDEEGRKRGRPTANVIVNNCTVYHSHGGFVIGSEMSGGVNNMFVSNCTFIGSDIGLRFKTTRGRGGMVENIYVNNVNMLDIPGEAILFDMYYAAQDPISANGEKREPPKVEFKAVDESTPAFQNFYMRNITCNGASKGIFIRGIPEMHVKNVWMENLLLQANQGIDIQEATNININNITMVSKKSDPLAYILNSDSVTITGLNYKDSADVLVQLQGERTKDIKVLNSNISLAKQKLSADYGATDKVIQWTLPVVDKGTKKKKKKK